MRACGLVSGVGVVRRGKERRSGGWRESLTLRPTHGTSVACLRVHDPEWCTEREEVQVLVGGGRPLGTLQSGRRIQPTHG